MNSEILVSEKKKSGCIVDPRTKLIVLLTLIILILGGAFQNSLFILLILFPVILFVLHKMWKSVFIYLIIFLGCLCLQKYTLPHMSGIAAYLMMLVIGMPLYLSPSIAAAYYVIKTTTVSEFIAGMERIHVPKQITIPMAVMFRFFPTVIEEWSAIGDAMKMRGIGFKSGKIGAVFEYRMIPMLMCSVKIGEELSAASLTRGLGGPVKRTNICTIGFKIQDYGLLLLCLLALILQIIIWIGR